MLNMTINNNIGIWSTDGSSKNDLKLMEAKTNFMATLKPQVNLVKFIGAVRDETIEGLCCTFPKFQWCMMDMKWICLHSIRHIGSSDVICDTRVSHSANESVANTTTTDELFAHFLFGTSDMSDSVHWINRVYVICEILLIPHSRSHHCDGVLRNNPPAMAHQQFFRHCRCPGKHADLLLEHLTRTGTSSCT